MNTYTNVSMNKILKYDNYFYTCIDRYNFNFSKMAIDTKLKFSAYTTYSYTCNYI